MDGETLYAVAAWATIGSFVLEVAIKIYQVCKGRNARKRIAREEAESEASKRK